jgi:hypothetical protein
MLVLVSRMMEPEQQHFSLDGWYHIWLPGLLSAGLLLLAGWACWGLWRGGRGLACRLLRTAPAAGAVPAPQPRIE